MADHGTVTLIPTAAPLGATGYTIGGTTPCPPPPATPTTGQIWPRGQGA